MSRVEEEPTQGTQACKVLKNKRKKPMSTREQIEWAREQLRKERVGQHGGGGSGSRPTRPGSRSGQ